MPKQLNLPTNAFTCPKCRSINARYDPDKQDEETNSSKVIVAMKCSSEPCGHRYTVEGHYSYGN